MKHGYWSWLALAGAAAVCLSCSKPDRERGASRRQTAASASAQKPPGVAPFEPSSAQPNGMLALTGPELLQRVRETKARGVLVNAWASWCMPCRNEMPMLVALSQSLPEIDVLFVSVDEPASWPQAASFLEQQGVAPPVRVVRGRLGPFKRTLNPEWQGMIPATFLFDPTGKLRYFWGGPVYEEEIVPILQGYLAGKHIDGEAIYGLAPGKTVRPETLTR